MISRKLYEIVGPEKKVKNKALYARQILNSKTVVHELHSFTVKELQTAVDYEENSENYSRKCQADLSCRCKGLFKISGEHILYACYLHAQLAVRTSEENRLAQE